MPLAEEPEQQFGPPPDAPAQCPNCRARGAWCSSVGACRSCCYCYVCSTPGKPRFHEP